MDERIAHLVHFEDLQKDNNSLSASFIVSEDLPSFKGHFPGDPILPAVSIIDICLHLLAQANPQISHTNIEVKKSKFMDMVRPGQEIIISAESPDGHSWTMQWRTKNDQTRLAQVLLVV